MFFGSWFWMMTHTSSGWEVEVVWLKKKKKKNFVPILAFAKPRRQVCIHAYKEKVSTCTHIQKSPKTKMHTHRSSIRILAATTRLFLSITIFSCLPFSLAPTQQSSFSHSFVTTSFSPTIGLNSLFPTQISFAYDFIHTSSPAISLPSCLIPSL